jgi:hypothetical protein
MMMMMIFSRHRGFSGSQLIARHTVAVNDYDEEDVDDIDDDISSNDCRRKTGYFVVSFYLVSGSSSLSSEFLFSQKTLNAIDDVNKENNNNELKLKS